MHNIKPFFLFLLILCSGCAANKSNIDDLQKEPPCPTQYTYNAGFKSVWQATIRALAKEEIIKTMNQDAGIVVTEFGTVDNFELNAIDTVMGARTYKYSYTINLRNTASTKTMVSIKTNIKMSQIALYEREQNVPWVENYLRKKLFIRICNQLIPGGSTRCDSILTSKINFESSLPNGTANEPDVSPSFRVLSESEAMLLRVQETLNTRGYSAGTPDGHMGPKTRKAIKQFQTDTTIAVTGIPDPNTLVALGLREGTLKKSAPKPKADTPPKPTQSNTKDIKIAADTELMQSKNPFSGVIETLSKGSLLTVVSQEEDWYKVQYGGRTGYVHASFIMEDGKTVIVRSPTVKPKEKPPVINKQPVKVVKIEQENNLLPEKPKAEGNIPKNVEVGKGKVTETTSLLSEPSFMANTIQDISAGQQIDLLEKREDFYKVRHKGEEGYIYADFVEVILDVLY